MIYADTSLIVSAYVEDANTREARGFIARHAPKLPFAFLHWPEVAGSFWKYHPEPEKRWELLQEDIAGGKKLYLAELDAEAVGRRAAGLMKHYCRRWQKLRALDTMHVSAAISGQFQTFLSFDSGSFQRALAADQKLQVWPPLTGEEKVRLAASVQPG